MAIKPLNAKEEARLEIEAREEEFRQMLQKYLPEVLEKLIKTGRIKIAR